MTDRKNLRTTDKQTKIKTVYGGNKERNNGNIGKSGDDENVEVQIIDTAEKVIKLTNGFKGEGDLQLKPGETEASATYTAQYYANGAASAGTVEATLQYAVSYL